MIGSYFHLDKNCEIERCILDIRRLLIQLRFLLDIMVEIVLDEENIVYHRDLIE